MSQGGHSTPRRCGGAAGRVLCGENERSVRQNGEGGGEGGGDVRAVRGGKVCRVLSSVHGVYLQRLRVFSQETQSLHRACCSEPQRSKKGRGQKHSLCGSPAPKCPDHDEPMKVFCFDCNHLICRDCTVIDHNGHNFNFLKKCAPESRKTLRDSLAPLRKVQADIAGTEKKLNTTEAQVDTQKNEVCKSLEQSFDLLKALLDQRKAELVKKASTLAQEKKDALAAQRKGLQVAQAEIQSLVEFVERNVENTSDQDLMGIRTQLQTKVEEEEKRHQQLSLEPATTANIACNPPSPDAIPRELGAVFPAGDLAKLNVTLPETCSVGESAQVSVKVPQSIGTNVQAQLKSLADPSWHLHHHLHPSGQGPT